MLSTEVAVLRILPAHLLLYTRSIYAPQVQRVDTIALKRLYKICERDYHASFAPYLTRSLIWIADDEDLSLKSAFAPVKTGIVFATGVDAETLLWYSGENWADVVPRICS